MARGFRSLRASRAQGREFYFGVQGEGFKGSEGKAEWNAAVLRG